MPDEQLWPLSPLGRGREAMTYGCVLQPSRACGADDAAVSHLAELVRGELRTGRPPHPARLAEGEPLVRLATFSPRGEGPLRPALRAGGTWEKR